MNWGICGERAGTCPDEIVLDTCPGTRTAILHRRLGKPPFSWNVKLKGCKYNYYAEYVCKPDLVAYWDQGACGPGGNDLNWGICGYRNGTCPDEIVLNTCPATHKAVLHRQLGKGMPPLSWNVSLNGCTYNYYAEYVCKPPVPTWRSTSMAPTGTNGSTAAPALVAYWDQGACGPGGDDMNWGICGYRNGTCPDEIVLNTCPATHKAVLHRQLGKGMPPLSWNVSLNGCTYN